MKKSEIENLFIEKGFTKNRFGHFDISTPETKLRAKFQAKSLRIEKRYTRSDNSNEWINLGSNYYSKLEIKNGKLGPFIGLANIKRWLNLDNLKGES